LGLKWTSWRLMVSFTIRPLYSQGMRALYPLDRRLVGPQSQSIWHGKEKNLAPARSHTPAT
jgi:hypothetical protein